MMNTAYQVLAAIVPVSNPSSPELLVEIVQEMADSETDCMIALLAATATVVAVATVMVSPLTAVAIAGRQEASRVSPAGKADATPLIIAVGRLVAI